MAEIAPIELELRKLGLTEKEVRVYLAGLELGPSSVKNIAEIAKIARPTTYEIIKGLEKKGLFAEAKQKTTTHPPPSRLRRAPKRFFIAQSPERILGILRVQKREIEEKEREFIRIIAALESRYSKEKEGIKVYKGKEGLKALAEIISFSSTPEIFIVNPKLNPIKIREKKKMFQAIKKRLGKVEVKEMNNKIEGSLIIFDKVIFFPAKKLEGFLIG